MSSLISSFFGGDSSQPLLLAILLQGPHVSARSMRHTIMERRKYIDWHDRTGQELVNWANETTRLFSLNLFQQNDYTTCTVATASSIRKKSIYRHLAIQPYWWLNVLAWYWRALCQFVGQSFSQKLFYTFIECQRAWYNGSTPTNPKL